MHDEMPSQEEVNNYLDILRESGVTNMFGAAPYIQEQFSVDKKSAREFLKVWMDTFSTRHVV